jgi:predicted RNase H-like nuclease (RuvC/YqgF family)
MQATGINDIDQIVKTFIQAEEKNFAIFKFVNELNIEIENYETQIFEMQSEIDKNLAEGGQDSQKRRQIKELERKLNSTNESIIAMESEQEKNLLKIKKIKECISKISRVVECDESLN